MQRNIRFLLGTGLMVLMGCSSQTKSTGERSVPLVNVSQQQEAGIIYSSANEGRSWVNLSTGLPASFELTDIASSPEWMGLVSKRQGIFSFDFQRNQWQKTWNLPTTVSNLDAMILHHNRLFVGTDKQGIFVSSDFGRTWQLYNQNLDNLTIRRFKVIDNTLYVGTNEGLYVLDESHHQWKLVYKQPGLQVNGITVLDDEIYIGTNQGAFKAKKGARNWEQVLPGRSLHNISADDKNVYAMVYNELMLSADKGQTWQSLQKGLPPTLYTFQVVKHGNSILAGQWDGVYKRENQGVRANQPWIASSQGLPENFAVTEMTTYKNNWIIGSSEWSNKLANKPKRF